MKGRDRRERRAWKVDTLATVSGSEGDTIVIDGKNRRLGSGAPLSEHGDRWIDRTSLGVTTGDVVPGGMV